MKKQVTVKIPKGTKCKNGVCEQDLELDTEIEIPELTPTISVNPSAELSIADQLPSLNNQVTQKQAIEKPEEPKIKAVPPSYQPKYKCKDGNCGQNHENPNYTTSIKGKCDNCGQFGPSDSGSCFWCKEGSFEPVDQEELEDMGIIPPKENHDHGG